jgi:cell division protein FtsB
MKTRRWKIVRPSRIAVAWVMTLTAAGALEVWLHLQTTEVGYQLSILHRMVGRLSSERNDLEAELATLTSPHALDVAAKTRLGLKPPAEGQIVGIP